MKGFGSYPNIEPQQATLIAEILEIANNASDKRYSVYRKHLIRAIEVSSGKEVRLAGEFYGWRKKNSFHPGGAYEQPYDFAGQTFYKLNPAFLERYRKTR
ncbi:hypothetical protein [Pseudomonas sp. RIT-PI-AD]|uniref:hypothetical protein n=1 Tax=Pseudomonas sp. RIT-PI-AD TaxID=3035294 RepID=UPI0021DA784D|nr:hypothetical protein [Pseudomonas sp. RIT-PI-AD]